MPLPKISGLTSNQIGVITPYKEQQRLLSSNLRDLAEVGTVDSFQGQERDIVIFDFVRANPDNDVGFTLQPNRLNVALSRARQKLIIVANLPTFLGHDRFSQLIESIRSMQNTSIQQINAVQLGIDLPKYRKRIEIQINPDMVDRIEEPEEQPPSAPITPVGNYLDIY